MKILLILVLFGIFINSSVSQLVNGDFEINSCGYNGPLACHYVAPSNPLPGWQVLSGDIDIHRTAGSGSGSQYAPQGDFFLDLNGLGAGEVSTTATTVVGYHYDLTFLFGGNVNCGPANLIKTMEISTPGNPSQQYTVDVSGRSAEFPGYTLQTYSFEATSTSTVITLTSLTPNIACGPIVDDFKLIPICTDEGTFHTQSEGDWGDSCSEGFITGCYRDDNFDTCFPNGLTVGCFCPPTKDPVNACGYSLHFDSSADVENFLPQLGAPGVLDHDYNNPSNPPPMSTSSGNFGGQVTALALSIGFSACDPNFHTACGKLEDLYVCDNRCANCKRNGNCRKNSNGCKYLREEELDIEEEDEIDFRTNKNTNFNNNNNGKPKYANCEAYFGKKISEIFDTAQRVLGGCANCGALSKKTEERNNKNNNNNCVRTSGCRRSAAARNNNNCNRNSDCKRNQNCCCCPDQADPNCDPVLLNNCVTLINQAFIFGKTLDDVDSGKLFKENGCTCGGDGFEWTATVNNQVVVLNPFVVFTDMGDYYGYSKAGGDASSANTPDGLEDSNHNKALVEFVTDGFGNHNLLVIYDTPNDADGGDAQTQIIHSGNLDGATFVVQDDTGEGVSISPGLATTNHIWSPCCTDGYVFGPIPNLACFTFVLGPTTGITALRLASKSAPGGTAIEVPKTDGDSITVDICNRCKQA